MLSGLTVGLVYRRIAERQGLATAFRRLLARAWTLYVLAVGLTFVMLTVSELLHLPWAAGLDASSPLAVVWAILSLHQTYYLVDVLALYVLLMLAAPIALFLLCEGQTWILLAVSWLTWLGFQVFPTQTELPWTIAGTTCFTSRPGRCCSSRRWRSASTASGSGPSSGKPGGRRCCWRARSASASSSWPTRPSPPSCRCSRAASRTSSACRRPTWRTRSSPRPTYASAASWRRWSCSASCSC